jgi:hypothetical protein
MDQQRFESALRLMNGASTRRSGLAAAIGILLGGTATIGNVTAGKKRRRHQREKKPNQDKGGCGGDCTGCCAGGECMPGTDYSACGDGGEACVDCRFETTGYICRLVGLDRRCYSGGDQG